MLALSGVGSVESNIAWTHRGMKLGNEGEENDVTMAPGEVGFAVDTRSGLPSPPLPSPSLGFSTKLKSSSVFEDPVTRMGEEACARPRTSLGAQPG